MYNYPQTYILAHNAKYGFLPPFHAVKLQNTKTTITCVKWIARFFFNSSEDRA